VVRKSAEGIEGMVLILKMEVPTMKKRVFVTIVGVILVKVEVSKHVGTLHYPLEG
jgi:hypothetical protein